MERRQDVIRFKVVTFSSSQSRLAGVFRNIQRLVLASMYVVTFCNYANGQTDVQQGPDVVSSIPRKIGVIHTPLAASEIPPVGSLMKVQLSLANTIDIETKVRLVGSKDGRFIDISFPTGALNNSDQPTFVAEMPSPIAAMSYQFIVHQKDGSLTSSPKFVMKRACIQNFTVNVPLENGTSNFRRELASLIAQANSVERDNKSLDASLKLLEEMKSSMSR